MKVLNFTGKGTEYFKIWIVNILLTLITLSLYYPWAKVRNHRYFYGNSQFNDTSFDYHATGKQIFKGYLIALGLFIVYQVLINLMPTAEMLMLVILFFGIPWIIWRSTKFEMRMTSYANVRFGFDGELSQSYVNFLVYPLISILAILAVIVSILVVIVPFEILAVIVPFVTFTTNIPILLKVIVGVFSFSVVFYMYGLIKQKNNSYLINGMRYGQGQFKTQLSVQKFLIIGLKTGAILLTAFAVFGLFFYGFFDLESVANTKISNIQSLMLFILYILMLGVYTFAIAYLISKEREYVYANTTLDNDISFASTLSAKDLTWMLIGNFLILIFTLGLGYPWTKIRMVRLMLQNTLVDAKQGFDVYIGQQQEKSSALADQLGDVFDVDIDVAL